MRRREFITLVGGAAVFRPLAARAQQGERTRRVGVLEGIPEDPYLAAFLQRLQQLGWVDGRNVQIDTRWGAGKVDAIRKYAAELSGLAPDVMDENDELVLIDEIHTPDSSRFWQLASYEERFKEDEEPQYFDKEFLRLWFKEHCDPYKDEKLPDAPAELVEELSRRYIQMYEQITGEKFVCGEKPIGQRIERNLKWYVTGAGSSAA